MKKNKWYTISVFIIICVLLNLAGKCIAGYFRLPLWLDSLGTVAATYVCGPVCGVIVGVTLNILYSIIYSWTYACYAIVSVSIAVVAGICISKDYNENTAWCTDIKLLYCTCFVFYFRDF